MFLPSSKGTIFAIGMLISVCMVLGYQLGELREIREDLQATREELKSFKVVSND